MKVFPEEEARIKIDKQLRLAGWDIVSRDEYIPQSASAVREALMRGNTESDYLLFVDDKAIAVLEAKAADNPLGADVQAQAEGYATHPQPWYGLWKAGMIPLVYLANGEKIYFRNLLQPDSEYAELSEIQSPKKMLQLLGQSSAYGALPYLERRGLRDCQYQAELNFESSLKAGLKKSLAILATGSGKTYLACLSSYRLLTYSRVGDSHKKRVLFLADRNNLARQAESEFCQFSRTERQQEMSAIYDIRRLRRPEDIQGDIVISTIQKLFAVLTGQQVTESDEDAEDEARAAEEEKDDTPPVQLGDDLRVPRDWFDLIIVDECHRSIYGKWKAVLDYFSSAHVLGLTATPTPEAYAFFNSQIIQRYTYEQSVVDGVNVPFRVYRIRTRVTEEGGILREGTRVEETARRNGREKRFVLKDTVEYYDAELDRTVTNPNQIREVLQAYKDAIYRDLYPERQEDWASIPKTLIFAKDDHHATEIVSAVQEVFGPAFESGTVPDGFVQKITYTAGNTDALIRELRTERAFRVAVTVTLVATGTDVRPLEVVLFMKDVFSDVLYTQMKGRGCRIITDEKLREVTPNADTKECYHIVDAVGVTEHEKVMPQPQPGEKERQKVLSLEELLEHLSHNHLSDENLWLLRDYCASIHRRYEDNAMFGRHLDQFIEEFGFSPRMLADRIQSAYDTNILPAFVSPSQPNAERQTLISCLMMNLPARRKLLELRHGYIIRTEEDPDELLYAGFSKETARALIDNFERYIDENRDSLEALRIIYNSEDKLITHGMLIELRDRLLAANRQFSAYQLWRNYQLLDEDGAVDALDVKANLKALTHLIQLVRFAWHKTPKLVSLMSGFGRRFSLYCGQAQRSLTEDQQALMRQIAEYVVNDGSITPLELNEINTDLWRRGIILFDAQGLASEMQTMAGMLLKAA